MKRAHLSDDRLIEICLTDPLAPIDEPHLRNCERCEHRRLVLASTLGDVSERVMSEVDAAFPAERLARQHARIMQQLDHLGRPARVIAFPVGRTQEPARPAVSVRRTRRWVAATGAIAVAFLVGIFTDHLAHQQPANRAVQTRIASRAIPTPVTRTVAASISMSDDEFLGQVEAAVGSTGPAALRPLDALTPRAWDVQ
ncbi:MAG TPA: hypothetical protein VIR54_09440 [Vicinamibacterales bacterium]|jgi:hypothetical protein